MSMSTTTATAPTAIAKTIGIRDEKKPADGGFHGPLGLRLISAHADEPE